MKSIISKISLLFATVVLSTTTLSAQEAPVNAVDVSPLLVGEKLPADSKLKDINGKDITFKKALNNKRSVVIFYRGSWCPYCNQQLSGLMEVEKEVLKLGYQIVAVSPDDYRNMLTTEEKNKLDYSLYSDPNGEFIKKVGIAFKTPEKTESYIKSKKLVGETTKVIPVPTVMVVDKDGKILFEYINPDYHVRLEENMLLAVLKSLKK